MPVSAQVPKDHPLMLAWEAHKQTEDYANSKTWAAHPQHVDGSLWALFEAGWRAAHLTQPAQAVDVDAVRAVIEQTREYYERTDDRRTAYALENVLSDIYETLTAALPNAQAVDGWQPTDDDVQAWRGRHNISLSLYDCRSAIEDARIMHHFDVRPAALPNAKGKEGES